MIPDLADAGIKAGIHGESAKHLNSTPALICCDCSAGPDTHSADFEPILGRMPMFENLYVATGLNSQGIQTSLGVGRAMAEWIIDGTPHSMNADFCELDVRR